MKSTIKVRSLAEADAGYSSAAETLQRLKEQNRKLDAEESTLLDRLANKPNAAASSSRVAALLGDIPSEDTEPDGARVRLRAIATERVDLRAAIDIATQRVTAARVAASRAICAEVKPEYGQRVKALADVLLAAHAAHGELLGLISELSGQDVAWSPLVPMQATAIFGHDDGRLAAWLKSAVDAGYVGKAGVPKELSV
jgi:hypothetical protein